MAPVSNVTADHPTEYVTVDDTVRTLSRNTANSSITFQIADVALKEKASAGLSTSISVLMSILLTASFFLNSALFATVLSRFYPINFHLILSDYCSYKLRKSLLYLMFCTLAM